MKTEYKTGRETVGYSSRASESIIKEYRDCEALTHFVVKTNWVKSLDTQFIKRCRDSVDVFFNRLFRNVLSKYGRSKVRAGIVTYCFWEIVTGKILHCHCIIGWPLKSYGRHKEDLEYVFDRVRDRCMDGLKALDRVWIDNREIDSMFVGYCLKECLESDHFASGIERVSVWRDGRMPEATKAWVEGGGSLAVA